MNCNKFGDRLLDLAAGAVPDVEIERHLEHCDDCAAKLASLMQTMAVLDDWKAPEPSEYFDSRLHARLREEAAKPARSWLEWLRKPALAMAMVCLMAVGISLYERETPSSNSTPQQQTATMSPQPGSAVADLQSLDKNHDLLANFDLLDDVDYQDMAGQDVNP
ncbi:MAG TPA: hypothetical protein VFM10_01495 [Terriglobales bacterium]|nr:hypothetical protein [Terriglobales bacterium]